MTHWKGDNEMLCAMKCLTDKLNSTSNCRSWEHLPICHWTLPNLNETGFFFFFSQDNISTINHYLSFAECFFQRVKVNTSQAEAKEPVPNKAPPQPNQLTMLALVLLDPDMSCLCFCKQCRSRSVGFFRSQLIWICTVCH